jgi:hypothetical protein
MSACAPVAEGYGQMGHPVGQMSTWTRARARTRRTYESWPRWAMSSCAGAVYFDEVVSSLTTEAWS